MSTNDALLQFAAELATFLVSVAGVAFALRPRVIPTSSTSRSLLGAGFLAQATAALLHGSLLVGDVDQPALVALRLGGLVLLVAGAPRPWQVARNGGGAGPVDRPAGAGVERAPSGPGLRTTYVLWAGLALLAVVEVLSWRGPSPALDAVQLAAALLLGAALLAASRRSIGARIGADATVLLLVVLLAVSVALSAVVSRNVEDEALRRYGSRGSTAASAAVGQAEDALGVARVVSGQVSASQPSDLAVLALPGSTADRLEMARQRLTDSLTGLLGPSALDQADPVVLVDPNGVVEAAAPLSLDNTTTLALASGPVAEEARRAQGQRQAVTVVGGRAYAVAAAPVWLHPTDAPPLFVGLAVVATPLDATYLRTLDTGAEPLSFALVTADRVLASSGPQPPTGRLLGLGAQVIRGGAEPSHVVGSRFVVARPVAAEGAEPDLALVTSVPTSVIASTRDALFRALFLIALGAAAVAVVLAVTAGERIGRGVRRLTAAARRIRDGDLVTPVEVTSADELGTLAATFDAMTGSLRQAEEMKTAFLSNIGHELRSPLTPIKGYTAAMQRRPPTADQARLYAGEIAAGVDQLERVIGQLVNFATIAAGRLDLRTEVVASDQLLDGCARRWSPRLNGTHRVVVDDGGPVLPPLEVDRGYLDQALDELVDNAVKYSPGGGTVVLRAERRPVDGPGDDRGADDRGAGEGEVWLTVADEGVGMDPEMVEQLCAEFAQADPSATREFGGLGIGLALVERIAVAHGGALRCRSGEVRGTVMSIVVPACGGDRRDGGTLAG